MKIRNIVLFFGGLVFGFGLAFSGMSKPEIVLSFLTLQDFGLIIVLGSAAIIAFIAIQIVPKFIERPLLGGEFKPRQRTLTRNTIIGAAIFGVGWGLSGMCPGSTLASFGTGNIVILVGLASIFLGAYVMGRFYGES
jgi:uncharacterized membrane protein YedE/YeeE